MGYTHHDKVSGVNGLAVGAKGSEVVVADSSGDLYIQGVKITASAAELNAAAGTGVDSTELGYLDGATAGTQVAEKCVVADANVNTGISKVTELHIGTSGSETQVTSTAAELNLLDGATAGTQVASVAVIADANINIGVSKVTELHIGSSGSEVQYFSSQPSAIADYSITWSSNEPTAGSSATIADGSSVTDAESGQAIADLTAKVNAILAALRTTAVIAT